MITVLCVNEIELTIDYDLESSPVYFGDLESRYIDIGLKKVTWNAPVWENGVEVMKPVNALPLIRALEDEEALKLILRDRMEDEA